MKTLLGLAGAGLTLAAAATAQAAIVTVTYTGHATALYTDSGYTEVEDGPLFSGQFSYDTSVAPWATSPSGDGGGGLAAYHDALTSFSWDGPGTSGDSLPIALIAVADGKTTFDLFKLQTTGNGPSLYAGIYMYDPTNTAFSSAALPDSLERDWFGTAYVDISTPTGGYFGPIDTLTSTSVPEPATWLMMILGFGAVGAALRHRVGARFA